MQNKNILFEEKQYLGHNRLSIVIRTALAIFCLFSYYLSENSNLLNINIFIIQNNSNSGFIFFVVEINHTNRVDYKLIDHTYLFSFMYYNTTATKIQYIWLIIFRVLL